MSDNSHEITHSKLRCPRCERFPVARLSTVRQNLHLPCWRAECCGIETRWRKRQIEALKDWRKIILEKYG